MPPTPDQPRPTGSAGLDSHFQFVYDEIHVLAEAIIQRNRALRPADTTSLIQDAYVRLSGRGMRFESRGHFLSVAAKAMRAALIDRARRLQAGKRDQRITVALPDDVLPAADAPDMVALDEALERLAAIDPAKSQLVELRYFGGLSIEETAEVMGQSAATLKREWALARAWLFRELSDPDPKS